MSLRRSVAILELERNGSARIGLTRLREWGLSSGASVSLERDGSAVASIVCEATRCGSCRPLAKAECSWRAKP